MKQRIISAAIALAIVIPLIIIGGTWYYLGLSIIGLIGFIEMMNAIKKERKIPLLISILSVICFIFIMMNGIFTTTAFLIDNKIIVISLLLLNIPVIFFKKENYNINDSLFLTGIVILLGLGFNYLMELRDLNVWYLIYVLLITTMSDTFAHFFGTNIGKYKLCPLVSPNKTIEGFIGGTIFGTFIGTCFYTAQFSYTSLIVIVLISLLLSVVGQIGDLFFSSIKRKYEIKDYGKIMPGHGGVLDRLDSILFVSLAFGIIVSCL